MSLGLVKTIGADGAVYCLNRGNDMFIHPYRLHVYSLRTNRNRIDSSGLPSHAYAR